MADIISRIPPQNLEAEQSLLGALLIDREAIIRIADIVTPDDFYKESHRVIYESMAHLYSKGEPIDILSLSNRIEELGKTERVGGRSYLASLANLVPTSSHVTTYAKIVAKKASLRRLISAAGKISELGFSEDEDVEQVLDQAEHELFTVSQHSLRQNFIPIKTVLADAFERIDELHREKGKLRGLSSGLRDLDHILAGFQKSDLIIVAARPSVGKTSLALDFARHAAIVSKVPVALFSLEMSKEQLVDRLLCAQAGVDLWKMRTGRLAERGGGEDDDFTKIGHAMGLLADAPIFIDDTAMTNIMEIRTKARRLQMEHGLGLIVLDYLQLMEGRAGQENRVQEVSEISRALKGIARELNVPLIALSQLNRSVESRSPAIPKLADLRESGSIEQDADVVMFIYRKAMDRTRFNTSEEEKNMAEIHIAKHRNGPVGQLEVYFDQTRTTFRDLDRHYAAADPASPN
ncbi:MAG: replicative DNA helicase [Patescibacteria group bacterium]